MCTFIHARGYIHFHDTSTAIRLGQSESSRRSLVCISKGNIHFGLDILPSRRIFSILSTAPHYIRKALIEVSSEKFRERLGSPKKAIQIVLVIDGIFTASAAS